MSRFIDAMDERQSESQQHHEEKQLGENGSPEFIAEAVGDDRVALFFALVRGIDKARLKELMIPVLRDTPADAFVMTFQTRNCRGGKGERDIFYWMILQLYDTYPETVTSLLMLIPHYGSYKDWFRLAEMATPAPAAAAAIDETKSELVDFIYSLASIQLLNHDHPNRTLLAKWAPREKHHKQQAKALAMKMFPTSKAPLKDYRQLVSSLNTSTTEVKMCANKWDDIRFSSVPSLALNKYRKAFLNETVGSVPTANEDETGNRYPEDEMRVRTRKRLRREMVDAKFKGKQLFPHEIVRNFLQTRTSSLEADLLQLQWNDIKASVMSAMNDKTAFHLGKLVAVADVSGSMSGTPMDVSIALSILVSELAAPAFAHRFITFSSTPTWVQLSETMSLMEKVQVTRCADWGMTTNFEKAMNLILDTAIQAKLEPDEIPDLIVFSDMQFDEASDSQSDDWESDQASDSQSDDWETQYKRMVRMYKEAGIRTTGRQWNPPKIIFWNLRGDTSGYPVQANTEGVTMLSGFSPSLLKLLLSGDEELPAAVLMEEEDGFAVVGKTKKNAYDTVRAALDDPAYDEVRQVLAKSTEGLLAKYEFVIKEEAVVEDNIEAEWVIDA